MKVESGLKVPISYQLTFNIHYNEGFCENHKSYKET